MLTKAMEKCLQLEGMKSRSDRIHNNAKKMNGISNSDYITLLLGCQDKMLDKYLIGISREHHSNMLLLRSTSESLSKRFKVLDEKKKSSTTYIFPEITHKVFMELHKEPEQQTKRERTISEPPMKSCRRGSVLIATLAVQGFTESRKSHRMDEGRGGSLVEETRFPPIAEASNQHVMRV
eukprot:sb/3471727/